MSGITSLSQWGMPQRRGEAPEASEVFLRVFFCGKILVNFLLYASAATVSAQVSTFVRIASSEYEVRLTWLRLNVSR